MLAWWPLHFRLETLRFCLGQILRHGSRLSCWGHHWGHVERRCDSPGAEPCRCSNYNMLPSSSMTPACWTVTPSFNQCRVPGAGMRLWQTLALRSLWLTISVLAIVIGIFDSLLQRHSGTLKTKCVLFQLKQQSVQTQTSLAREAKSQFYVISGWDCSLFNWLERRAAYLYCYFNFAFVQKTNIRSI